MTKQEFLELLDRYLAGQTTEAENEILLKVYQEMEGRVQPDEPEIIGTPEMEERLVRRFELAIQQRPFNPKASGTVVRSFYNRYKTVLNIAASVLLVLGFIVLYRIGHTDIPAAPGVFKEDNKTFVSYQNVSPGKARVYFSDKSYVELESGSRIQYEKVFTGRQRKVYLEGTGFFQVTKDHTMPFLVFTDRLVTKVLGTSFIVRSTGVNASASVTVLTGKVAVFKKSEFKDENAAADLQGGLLLTPNHAAALTTEEKFVKKLADKPAVIKTSQDISFNFDNTPVSEVFERLEAAYNIEIVYDPQKLKNCALSVDMGQEDYFHKLDLICHTLNLSYVTDKEKIFISGQGCAN